MPILLLQKQGEKVGKTIISIRFPKGKLRGVTSAAGDYWELKIRLRRIIYLRKSL